MAGPHAHKKPLVHVTTTCHKEGRLWGEAPPTNAEIPSAWNFGVDQPGFSSSLSFSLSATSAKIPGISPCETSPCLWFILRTVSHRLGASLQLDIMMVRNRHWFPLDHPLPRPAVLVPGNVHSAGYYVWGGVSLGSLLLFWHGSLFTRYFRHFLYFSVQNLPPHSIQTFVKAVLHSQWLLWYFWSCLNPALFLPEP